MKILPRYIFISLLKPLTFALIAFFALWLIYDLFDTLGDFITNHARFLLVLEFYLLQLPKIAQTVIPVAFFFATIKTMASFSKNQELSILQASGLSLAKICWPFFLTALVLTGVLLLLNISLTSTAESDRRRIRTTVRGDTAKTQTRSVIYYNQLDGHMWYLPKLDFKKGTFENGEILIRRADGRDDYKLFAFSGTYNGKSWDLEHVRKVQFNGEGIAQPSTDHTVLSVPQLTETPEQLAVSMIQPDELTWSRLWSVISSPTPPPTSRLNLCLTEHYNRMAYPCICLVLCLFGIGLGINPPRYSVTTSVLNSIFVLFALLVWIQLFTAIGNGGRLSAWIAAWSSIFVFGIGGLYIFAEKVGWLWMIKMKLQHKEDPLPDSPHTISPDIHLGDRDQSQGPVSS